ncbi:DUF2975 domain-containing protein [Mucilaginibacter sp. UR6-11]|uniref:DUF2975 domain-containing protein n=1 Tax=Mucilaginibacter sp. UR6-11 TaxID=1435644 RepID=UPI001E40C48E|nr:DUF2975 domain-containing protein [Mucilaginibacter sp. UR6-11]MCC8427067.1 DUF2975 domain-containing protein [Mucilaginibacter sp. UR6-11]
MKIKLTTKSLIGIVVGSLFAIAPIILMQVYLKPATLTLTDSTSSVITIDQLKPIDPEVPDTLPYYQDLAKRDSIRLRRNLKNQNVFRTSSMYFYTVIGTTGGYLYCDTCTDLYYLFKSRSKSYPVQYYITLPAWKLKNAFGDHLFGDSVKFYREHNQSYLRKMLTKRVAGGGRYAEHMYEVDVPVKYSYDTSVEGIMIPVNKGTRTAVNVITIIFDGALLFYCGYLLSCFLAFIVDLSRGKAFTTSNINTLRLIAFSLLIFPFVMLSLVFLMKLVFYQYFTPEVILNNTAWIDLWKPFATGIVFLLLFSAFKQGKVLKDEQDLTV